MLFFAILEQLGDAERLFAEKIFNDYGKRIYEIAYKIVKNRQDAEDVLDNVMISIMKNLDKFIDKDETSIQAQIVTYSKNTAINVYNKNKRKVLNEVPFSDFEEQGNELDIADGTTEIEKIVVSNETVRIVREKIELLPEDYEDALSLYYIYGYSYSEISELLHISENNVAVKIFRAKKKLINLAGDELYERTKQ